MKIKYINILGEIYTNVVIEFMSTADLMKAIEEHKVIHMSIDGVSTYINSDYIVSYELVEQIINNSNKVEVIYDSKR